MEKKVIKLGSATTRESQGGGTYRREGVFPTICACTHGYAIGNVLRRYEKEKDNHTRDNKSRGL